MYISAIAELYFKMLSYLEWVSLFVPFRYTMCEFANKNVTWNILAEKKKQCAVKYFIFVGLNFRGFQKID